MTSVYEKFIRDAATKRGIDPDIAVRVAKSEGGVDTPGLVGKFATGWSFWNFQLHYGGEGYEQYGTTAGMGTAFTKLTGWNPGDPDASFDAARYALNRVKTGGWSPFYGAAAVGVGQWDGINRNSPWNPDSEVWDFERKAAPTTPPVYDPDTPPERQVQDWVCSIRTATWMLKSLGVDIDAGAMQDIMVPKYVTPALGLLDGRGYGFAEVLRTKVPPGSTVTVHENVSWDDLHSWAGSGPIGIGSSSLYHWLAVADVIDTDTLKAANPAPNYPAGSPVGDQLTRAEFDRWSPWNAVRVETKSTTTPPTGDPRDEMIASLKRDLDEARSKLGVASVDYAQNLQDLANALRALKPPE